ncbi:MAG TPA: serine hydrolase domain-containing protein [Steroidobacteraceae bacterium]|nr:serine hydrolase domain-containing protein [Steroidobacteraceae bacterium]
MATAVVLAALLAAQAAGVTIERAIEEEVAQGFSGAVLVAQGDRLLVEGVYGSMSGKTLPAAGRFLIASAGKQYTSAALAKLQDLRRLDLDDPIARHLSGTPADKREITIRQLLSHTSGLPQGYGSERAANAEEATREIFGIPLTASPGSKFQYSNENYQLAAALVEAVSGRSYSAFVHDELLRPAGLRETGQLDGPASVARLSPLAGPLPPRLLDLRWGSFGYYTTAGDFHRWFRAIRSGDVLTQAAASELFAPIAKIGEGHAMLGWFTGTSPAGEALIFTRGNDDIGASSVLYAYPGSDTVIVVLSHAGQKTDELSWARAVHSRIEEILFGAAAK